MTKDQLEYYSGADIKYPEECENCSKDELKQLRNKYHTLLAERKDEFYNYLARTSRANFKVSRIIFDKAWENSHSDGVAEVEAEFNDLLDFADSLFEASISQI